MVDWCLTCICLSSNMPSELHPSPIKGLRLTLSGQKLRQHGFNSRPVALLVKTTLVMVFLCTKEVAATWIEHHRWNMEWRRMGLPVSNSELKSGASTAVADPKNFSSTSIKTTKVSWLRFVLGEIKGFTKSAVHQSTSVMVKEPSSRSCFITCLNFGYSNLKTCSKCFSSCSCTSYSEPGLPSKYLIPASSQTSQPGSWFHLRSCLGWRVTRKVRQTIRISRAWCEIW